MSTAKNCVGGGPLFQILRGRGIAFKPQPPSPPMLIYATGHYNVYPPQQNLVDVDGLEQWFSTVGTRPGTGTWRPSYPDLELFLKQF
jgi:hypothetical protein